MPQAPYQPVPDAPQNVPTPEVRVQTNLAAFGGAVGQAMQSVGAKIEHSGDQIWAQAIHIQNERNQTEAREADVEYMRVAGQLHAKFNSLEGNQIAKAYPKYIEDLEQARQSVRTGMTNPAAQKMFDGPSTNFLGRSIFNGAGVAAAGIKQARKQADAAQLDTLRNVAASNPNDDIGFNDALQRTRQVVASQGRDAGWDPVVVKDQTTKAESALKTDRIVGMARTEPMTAMKLLEYYGPDLKVADRERAENMVYGRASNVTGRNTADAILSNLGDKEDKRTLKDYVAEGTAAVENMKIQDPSLEAQVKTSVESNIIAKYNRFEKQKHDANIQNMQTISNGLIGGFSDGKIPTTMDELLHSSPEVQLAYDDMPPADKRKVMNIVAANAKRGDRVDEATSYKTRQQFEGLAQSNPNEFLSADLWAGDVKMNQKDRAALLKKRDQMIKTPGADPHVARAMNWVRADRAAEMAALNIYNRNDSKEKYDEFVGGMSMAIQDFQENNKKLPTKKDVIEMADALMFQQRKTPWYWMGDKVRIKAPNWLTTGKPYFNEEPPEAFIDKLTNEVRARGKQDLTIEQMKREWLRQRWKEHYSGSVTEGGE